jgi:UDP-N-acetylglucosamine--N-acetylmuramyl-(pentapeptide) pyrophosphoryl-undecaprenol N-acetylglucosamine transferase
MAALPEALRHRLAIQQQTRVESMETCPADLRDAVVDAEIAPLLPRHGQPPGRRPPGDRPRGAGSVCEFAVAGKPSILVPLAIALDDDQGQNAKLLADAGGAEIAREHQLTVDTLANALEKLLTTGAARPHGRRRPLGRHPRRCRAPGRRRRAARPRLANGRG